MRVTRSLTKSPARVSILGFSITILIGTVLLMLPAASPGKSLGFINALFTSTSATCVTGLVVVDTGQAFTTFGQVVILALIQAGGLGIMTISTLFLLLAGRRPSLSGRFTVQDNLTGGGERNLFHVLRNVVAFTFLIEGLGMVILFLRFSSENSVSHALYLALFHSVSAFCNAGFALFSDSFISYREDWVLNLAICFLIFTGGIGFLVLSEIKQKRPFTRRALSQLSLHSKMVLSTTALLLFFSTLLIVSMEWHNVLLPLPPAKRLLAGFFQAVTSRTAGFNTLPIGSMANESLFLIILLMFVGASPGSCGGGIKTTTLTCIALLGISRFQGRRRPEIFRRTISEDSMNKAISIINLSFFIIVGATFLLLVIELGEVSHQASRGKFLELLFEVVSAFGTVGLSTGVTQMLSDAGKLIIVFVMFIGRLGPLVIALAVSDRVPAHYQYAEERVMIG
jgi:trk system potassium uptake protein TrkH